MKNDLIINVALAIGGCIWAGIVLFSMPQHNSFPSNITPSQPTQATNPSTITSGYTNIEVAKHATPSDCWMIIDAHVYAVTSYLSQHPGGAETMIPFCGKEATQAFETKDGMGSHSRRAQNLLQKFYIGDIKQ